MKRWVLWFAILIPPLALLLFSLTRNPRDLPSTLIGRPAPPFELTTLDGKKASLSQTQGDPLVLNFWSTWCGPCVGEHQLIRQAMKQYGNSQVTFYSILYEDTVENARAFLTRFGEAAPILLDADLRTAIDYGVSGVPETFFIDRNGIVLYKQSGMLRSEILFGQIERLLAKERR